MSLKTNLKTKVTTGDNFSALRDATARLVDSGGNMTTAELMSIDRSRHPNVDALIDEYACTQKPVTEFEEQLWQTVETYLQQLDGAYRGALQKIAHEDEELTAQALQHRMALLGLLAYCHYLRYQPLPANFWLELHAVYRAAEQVKAFADSGAGCDASYLQALMLSTVNHTNMLKWEITLVNNWLEDWCKEVSIAREYDATQQLFFVDLEADRGARRMRDFVPAPTYRYWEVDAIANVLEAMRQQLASDILPPEFNEKTTVANALGLVEQLLAEWSHADYRRQRRDEEREGVSKSAQVVHGIFNVCQHVKNIEFASVSSTEGHFYRDADLIEPGAGNANHWVIENESTFGFGAVVNSGLNLWLKPGRLIALDYEFNPDLTVVGVVRSIQQQFEDDCYVGIEVLSHTPSYVRLVHLAGVDATSDDAEPFSALYLAKDDDRGQVATLVIPAFEYIPSGFYELRLQRRVYRLQLGDILEQRDDWLRSGLEILAKSA